MLLKEGEAVLANFKQNNEEIMRVVRENSLSVYDVPYFENDIFYEALDFYIMLTGSITDNIPLSSSDSPLGASSFALPSHRNKSRIEATKPRITLP